MGRFPRPEGAIESASDLKVGDRIWHVYGIWPPQMGGEFTVERAAIPYSQHPKNNPSPQDDSVVFDVCWVRGKFTTMEFASDGNMKPNHSHNDNYWFRTEAEALAAVNFLRNEWEAVPGLIAEEVRRREEDRILYLYEDCE